jgi:PAS domain S-box-containing protein
MNGPDRPTDVAVLEAMLDQADSPIAFLDPALRYVRVNRPYARNSGAAPEALVGRGHFDVFPAEAARRPWFEEVLGSGRPGAVEEAPFVLPWHPEGRVTYWNWTLAPVAGRGGAVAGLVLSARDVTELVLARRRAEATEALAVRRAAELQAVLDAVPAAIFFARDATCSDVQGNAVGQRLLGAAAGTNLSRSAPAPERTPYRTLRGGVEHPPEALPMQRAAREGVEVRDEEWEIVRPDGTRRFILGGATPLRAPGVQGAVGAFVDITARKEAERALAETDRRKDEFLAMLSHELRNPLTPVQNAVAILRLAPPASEAARRARAVIERQVGHFTRLVDDLLDITRIGQGKIALRREPVDLAAVVRRAAEDHVNVLAGRGVDLLPDLPAGALWVEGDPTRLSQVVGNLLHNAAKFTPAGGRVTLSARGGPDGVELEVEDTGAGIEPLLLERIFEPFVQADGSPAGSKGGLGLGLALVRGIAELHGGTVRAESAGPGHGARFRVTLPGARAPRADDGGAPADAPHAPTAERWLSRPA